MSDQALTIAGKDITKLQPKTDGPPEVDVDIQERIATDEEVARHLRDLGMVRMAASRVAMLTKLGVHMTSRGLIRGQRGGAFLTQQRLMDTIELCHLQLHKTFEGKSKKKVDEMCKLATAIGYNSTALTKSQEFVVSMEQPDTVLPPPLPGDAPPNKSFLAGQIVGAKEVHYHVHNEPKADVPAATG